MISPPSGDLAGSSDLRESVGPSGLPSRFSKGLKAPDGLSTLATVKTAEDWLGSISASSLVSSS